MRYKTFLKRVLSTGEVESIPFEEVHYQLMGLQFAPLGGMPFFEALQLTNLWNVAQVEQHTVYGLE